MNVQRTDSLCFPSADRGKRHVKIARVEWAAQRSMTYGPPELCAWQIESGVFWIQTTKPEYCRKLEKRENVRRVEISGVNHFRRTFEIQGTWRKIRRIIDRYLVSAGDQFSGTFRPQNASKRAGSINTAERNAFVVSHRHVDKTENVKIGARVDELHGCGFGQQPNK